MCGIFGVVARRQAPYSQDFVRRSLDILMAESQSRGKDSSGLAFRDDGSATYQVFKGPLRLNALLRSPDVSSCLSRMLALYGTGDRRAFGVIGHSRLVTNGTQLHDDNNQPV